VHKFWKLAAPVMLRLRKDECGQSIVPKIIKPINLQPGDEQQEVYRFFVENPPTEAQSGGTLAVRTAIGMQLNLLRMAALCPHAPGLARVRTGSLGKQRSSTAWNPKMAACLSLVHEILCKGEQVLIGSPFTDFSSALQEKLVEAGVASVLLDGGTNPKKRGELAAAFKKGHYRVMVAGLKAMGEGHSFECANHLILPSLSYALDENEQFIHRVWRLTSQKPVTIYPMRIVGTVDDKMLDMFEQKRDAANLALDGRLIQNEVDELDLAQLLAEVVNDYRTSDSTVSEKDMAKRWPDLVMKLRGIEGAERRAA
jgi:SNF2 family DNA or RNA helicase